MKREGTKRMFDYENYRKLLKKIDQTVSGEERSDLHETIEEGMLACVEYVKSVDAMELAMPRIMATCEGAERRERISEYDHNRRVAHDLAMAQVCILNRLSACFGNGPICRGEKLDRLQVADFCIDAAETVFQKRQS